MGLIVRGGDSPLTENSDGVGARPFVLGAFCATPLGSCRQAVEGYGPSTRVWSFTAIPSIEHFDVRIRIAAHRLFVPTYRP